MRKGRAAALFQELHSRFPYSRALQGLAGNSRILRLQFSREPRKIVPVAWLAREFGVSTRLLWRWIGDDLLRKAKGGVGCKRGVSRSEVKRFLKALEKAMESSFEFGWIESRAGRPDTAQQRIRDARRNGLSGQGMNPRQFALAVGVSRSAVWRAIESGLLDAWRPTPHRTLIGKRPRKPRK